MTNKSSSWLSQLIDNVSSGFAESKAIHDAAAAAAAQRAAVQTTADQKMMGNALIMAPLAGVGLGLAGTRLYHLVNQLHKPKETHMKFSPGAQTIDDEEKIAIATVADVTKTIGDNYDAATQAVGKLFSFKDPQNRDAALYPALILGTGLGLYGGNRLMSGILEKKRKDELAAKVEEAKKDYQRALMGRKYAAAFDSAFAAVKKADAKDTALAVADTAMFDPLRLTGTLPWYTTALASLGLLSGKMTYDWTRARSKDKAFENARKARARMTGAQPLYIDPEQLAAVKKLAD